MRIAFIVPAPFDLLTGGYQYDRRVVTELRRMGHEVCVLELAGHHPLPDSEARASARTIWEGLEPGCVVVIDNLGLASFSDLAEELAHRGVCVLNHHPTGFETGLPAPDRLQLVDIEYRMMPLARNVIATSATTAQTLVSDFAVDPGRIAVVEPGSDDAPRSAGSDTARPNLLSIGSLIPRKGHDVLLRAMARLFDLDWHLTVAGSARHDPETAAALLQLVKTLGISDRVTFLGELTGAPLAQVWHAADIFALATHYEGYGMVIAEALKHGLPLAVCGGGAAGALVTPQTGVVCPPGDIDQLSKALRRLIFDKALRQAMSGAAWDAGAALPSWTDQAGRFAQALAGAQN